MLEDQTFEKIEIAEHVIELLYKGCTVQAVAFGQNVGLLVKRASTVPVMFEITAPPLDAYRAAVDHLREVEDSPSINEELEALDALSRRHMRVPFVELGEEARCTCGSTAGLLVEGVVTFKYSWLDGNKHVDYNIRTRWLEHGQCPDCKQTYLIK